MLQSAVSNGIVRDVVTLVYGSVSAELDSLATPSVLEIAASNRRGAPQALKTSATENETVSKMNRRVFRAVEGDRASWKRNGDNPWASVIPFLQEHM